MWGPFVSQIINKKYRGEIKIELHCDKLYDNNLLR